MIGLWPEGDLEVLVSAVLALAVLDVALLVGLVVRASRRRRRARTFLVPAPWPAAPYRVRPDRLVARPDGRLVVERESLPDLVSVRPVLSGLVLVRVDLVEGRLTLPEVETREVDGR